MTDHAAIVREGAAFYMAHKYVPNGDGTERHVAEGCKGCAAEAALSALEQERDDANETAVMAKSCVVKLEDRVSALEQELAEADERRLMDASAIRLQSELREAAEAEVRRLEQELAEAKERSVHAIGHERAEAAEQELAEAKRNVELLAQDNTVIALRVTANTLVAAEARITELEAEIERLGQQMYYECVPKGEANKRIAEEQEISLGWAREANARAGAAQAEVRRLREALAPFRMLVETFSNLGPFTSDDGEGLGRLSADEWINLRPRVHAYITAAAALAAGSVAAADNTGKEQT